VHGERLGVKLTQIARMRVARCCRDSRNMRGAMPLAELDELLVDDYASRQSAFNLWHSQTSSTVISPSSSKIASRNR
jgi:hypothetical protein